MTALQTSSLSTLAARKVRLFSIAAAVFLASPNLATAQGQWEEYLQSHSIMELGARMEGGPTWPRLDYRSLEDRRVALLFVALCRKEYERAEAIDQKRNLATYATMLSSLGKSGGYLNNVLRDIIYRKALSDLGSAIVHHPDRSGEIEALLSSLRPGPWRNAEIGQMIAVHLGDPSLQVAFSTWPEDNQLLERVNALFGMGMEPLFLTPTSTALIEQPSPHDLIFRMAETQCMLSYSLPRLLSYLKHGGDLNDLDGRDVRQFLVVMGCDG
jgi:hypothetical protein